MRETTSLRNMLAAAIADRTAAREQERTIKVQVDRVKAYLTDAQKQLAAFDNLADEIGKFRSDKIKAWATEGSGPQSSMDLPTELADRVAQQSRCREHVEAARLALTTIEAEAADALAGRGRAEAEAKAAALHVLLHDSEGLAVELVATRQREYELTVRLAALANIFDWLCRDEQSKPLHLPFPTVIKAALQPFMPPQLAGNMPKPDDVERARWRKYLTDLLNDPQAKIDCAVRPPA